MLRAECPCIINGHCGGAGSFRLYYLGDTFFGGVTVLTETMERRFISRGFGSWLAPVQGPERGRELRQQQKVPKLSRSLHGRQRRGHQGQICPQVPASTGKLPLANFE